MRSLLRAVAFSFCATSVSLTVTTTMPKNIIIDTDLFSDVDDAGALLLAATLPNIKLLAVNINYPSTFSALAASAILAHYGHADVPIGIRRPLTNVTFFDSWFYELGEYASKVAFHWSGGSLPWGRAEEAWDPVDLYRKTLAGVEDESVTIVSIGFLDNLSAPLNSTADTHSPLSGHALIARKVSSLVIMGGGYPSGRSYNFYGSNPNPAAHVVNTWDGGIVFVGDDVGKDVLSGSRLMAEAPVTDPVHMAYIYYSYYTPRSSWDPLTVLYAANGLGELFELGNEFGYNFVDADSGTNRWVWDPEVRNQFFLRLKAGNDTVASELDRLFLKGAAEAAEMRAGRKVPLGAVPGRQTQDEL